MNVRERYIQTGTYTFSGVALGVSTLELSAHVLEFPNDAHTTLSQNLIGCSTLNQEYCKLIG